MLFLPKQACLHLLFENQNTIVSLQNVRYQMGDNESSRQPTCAAEQLKAGFASFDSAAFLAAQHKEREKKGKCVKKIPKS